MAALLFRRQSVPVAVSASLPTTGRTRKVGAFGAGDIPEILLPFKAVPA